MPIFGVDVSRHQGTAIDWEGVRASGIDFMIARASLATTPDPTYRLNVRRARLAGIPVVGGYHFLYPASVVSPAAQARLFVARLEDADGVLAMLDVEKDRNPRTGQVHIPTIGDARAFAAEFARLTNGHTLIIYAPSWYWHGHIGNPRAADLGPLCASRYVPVREDANGNPIRMTPAEAFAKVPPRFWRPNHGGWTRTAFLQFTSTGKVRGYGGRIDVNAFNGTLQQLKALTGPAGLPLSALVLPASAGHPPGQATAATVAAGQPAAVSATQPAAVSATQPAAVSAAQPVAVSTPAKRRFHVVVRGETLSGIAARHGFRPTSKLPAFRVLVNAFPENARFRANPGLIHPGDRVRVR